MDTEDQWRIGQRILDNIYLGAVGAAINKDWLRKSKITHILDCGSPLCYQKRRHPGIYYLSHWMMEDSLDQDLTKFFKSSHEFIEEGNKTGRAILIHCQAGISRSSAILISYLIVRRGLSYDEAIALVRKSRPIVRPNSSFVQQLQKAEQTLKSLKAEISRGLSNAQ